MRCKTSLIVSISLLMSSIPAYSDDDAERSAPHASGSLSYEVDRSDVGSADWRDAIATAKSHMSRFGGYYSLMRVVLKTAAPGEKIRVDATKLKDLTSEYHGGGRQFRSVKSGEFVFIEHINSARRQNGKDPVVLESAARGKSTVWIDVPKRGSLAIVGDIEVQANPAAGQDGSSSAKAADLTNGFLQPGEWWNLYSDHENDPLKRSVRAVKIIQLNKQHASWVQITFPEDRDEHVSIFGPAAKVHGGGTIGLDAALAKWEKGITDWRTMWINLDFVVHMSKVE